MSKVTAQQVVDAMLEDHANADEFHERPGGAKDIWRQGGHKKFDFKKHLFTGKRPGETKSDETDEPEEKEKPVSIKSRFNWKPLK